MTRQRIQPVRRRPIAQRQSQTSSRRGKPARRVGGRLDEVVGRLQGLSIRSPARSPNPRRNRKQYTDDGGAELTSLQVATGRAQARTLQQAWKKLSANTQSNVYWVQNVNRYMTPATATACPGASQVGTQWSGTSIGAGAAILPLHLWSLSCAPQFVTGGTVTKPTGCWVLNRLSASGALNFSSYFNYDCSNTAGTQGSSGTYNQLSFPGQTDELKSVAIKMVLYGTTTRPVKYRIDLVQLMEPYLHPDYIQASTTTAPETAATTLFYDELTREYTYSPATFADGNATKGKIKYLKTYTHIIQPKLSSEAATQENYSGTAEVTTSIPHSHLFNMYHQLNRSQRYNWDDNVATAEPTLNTGDSTSPQQGINKTDVTYRARVYLMVRALAPSPTINATWEPTVTPSYDISIRTYHNNLS